MFEDWPEGTLLRQLQLLNTISLRLYVLIIDAPMRKLLKAL